MHGMHCEVRIASIRALVERIRSEGMPLLPPLDLLHSVVPQRILRMASPLRSRPKLIGTSGYPQASEAWMSQGESGQQEWGRGLIWGGAECRGLELGFVLGFGDDFPQRSGVPAVGRAKRLLLA